MKLTRKIFAFVLAFSMIFSLALCANAATFSDVPENHERYEAINELSGLGIINGYTDGTFQPDKAVTRAEMAKLIATLFSIEEAGTGANPFTDVKEDCWALNYIIAVKNLGIINGFPDGTFLPDAEVTYEQAVKMIVCALNYGEASKSYEKEGDWSSGYRTMASKLGISKNAIMTVNEPSPRGIIAQLLFNSLDVAPAVAVKDANGNISYQPGDQTLKNQNSYESLKNVKIICTPTINLDDSDKLIKDGYVRLLDSKGNKYDMSVNKNTGIYDLIGRYVNVTYEEQSKDYIIKTITDLSKETDLKIEKIKSVSTGEIEYYTNDNYSSTSKITVKNPTVIYNERPLNDSSKYVDLLNDAMKLTTSDGTALNFFGDVKIAESGNNTLLVIKSYKSYYMDVSVNTSTYEVTLEGKTNPVIMNVKDTGNYEIIKKTSLTDKGSAVTTLSIPTKSVVTISESYDDSIGTKYIEFFVNSSKTTGTPTESKTPKGPYPGLVKIGSSELYVTNTVAYSQMSVNSTSQFYKDASGNIVYVASTSDGNKRFGFYSQFVSGDTNETDSAIFKFYDPEAGSTFQVMISDPDDIANILKPGRDAGKLFWMNISGSKVRAGDIKYAEDVTTSNDSDITSVTYYTGDKVYAETSGYTIQTTGESDIKITELSSNRIQLPRPDLGKSTVNYTKGSITVSTAVKYPNPEAYQIKRKDGSKTVLLYDALKQLQSSSPVYVVNEVSGQTKVGDTSVVQISYYNFKTGAESSKDLLIEASVASNLDLKKGDVFSYYSDCDTEGLDIDNSECVFVLMRASEVAENRGSNLSFDSALTDCDNQNASNTTDGFRKFRIDTTHNIGNNYYNYTLSLPLWYDSENNKLALARTNVGGNTGNLNTYLAHDEELKTKLTPVFGNEMGWTKEAIFEAMGSDTTEKNMSNSVKVFVYDADAASDEEILVYKNGITNDELKVLLGELSTLESNKAASVDDINVAAQKCDLIYAYFESYTSTLKTIYIIK